LKRTGRAPRLGAARLVTICVLAMVTLLALAGCSIGPLDLSGGTPVPTGTPPPPTDTVPPPTPTTAPRALSGLIADAYTSKPIAGAEVTAGGILTATNNDGMFFYDDVPLNSELTVSAGGYHSFSAETGVISKLDVKLRPNTISGRVTDASTSRPLAGVLVKLVLPAAPVTNTAPITPSTEVTGTVQPPATPSTSTLLYGKVLAAPVRAMTAYTEIAEPTNTAVITDTGPTKTPAPPTATPTPKPIPPTGEGFVAVYTDEDGNYFFKDVPDGASLTLKMPGYKLTKEPLGETARKDIALEEFRVEAAYITANWASSPDLMEDTLAWIKDSRINAIVLNVQNDASEWVFDTKNPDALAAENTDIFMPDMADFVQQLKDQGLYVIARVVTFQQKTMAEARPDWAVKSDITGEPWKGGYAGQQKWLDASNPGAQDHLVAMTKEVLDLGFDEIQYDYVRFPSDPAPGEGEQVYSTGTLTDTGKVAALKVFLKKAHDVIEPTDAFMSIDVFGYTLWPDRDGAPILGIIGQVIPELINETDYISPMIYPSHFSPGEQDCPKPAVCAYELIHKSGEYAEKLFAGHKTKYRPWLQAFDWPGADYTSPGSQKIPDQIRAARETNAWGWMWWDPANEYEPRSAFKK
jgi:hypothetical protein